MRNNTALTSKLQSLGLSKDEVAIFVTLLGGQKTQIQISRDTGIARSNVYRIIDGLIEKSLVHELTTDEGKLLEAARPEALELLVVEQEHKAERQRMTLDQVTTMLADLKSSEGDYAIKTYSGVAGLKQMLWNELKTKSDICIFSCGTLNPATSKKWAEKYRAEIVQRGIVQRSLENPGTTETQSDVTDYSKHYRVRRIDASILKIQPEITIHDDTVSIYNAWTNNVQLGTEIKNPLLAHFMRQLFEHYWQLAGK